MTEPKEPEQIEPSDDKPSLEVMDSSAIEAIQRAEIDVAVATARRFKRDVAASLKTCRELALRNPKIADKCNYALPRGNKRLIGPSIHFARIVKYSWGHLNSGSQVIWCNRDYARVLGVCHDMQTNVREANIMDWPVQPPHNKTPERWKDQMNLATRAGTAVAERNAIFGCIPMVLFEDVLEEAKLLAVGKGKSFIESRNNAVSACKELKITQPMIYRALEVSGLESITTDHLIWLHAALQSIREQVSTVEELFGPEKPVSEKARAPKKGDKGLDVSSPISAPEKPEPKESKAPSRTPPPASPPEKDDLLFSDTDPGTDIATSMQNQLNHLIRSAGIDRNEFFTYLNWCGVKHARDPKLQVLTAVDLGPGDLGETVENWDANLEGFTSWREAQHAS